MNQSIKTFLIEDNPGDIRLIQEMLSTLTPGMELEWAESLSEGIERIARPGRHVDVILLDLSLPDSSGLETFLEVKAGFPHVPIVILSGNDNEEVAAKAVREGAQDYIVKDQIDGLLLARSLRYAIERKSAEQALTRSEAAFASLANNFPGAMYRCRFDSLRTVEYLSEGIRELTGYGPEEFIDNCIRSFSSIIVDDDRIDVFEKIQKALIERCPFSIEYRIVDIFRNIKWVWEKGFVVDSISSILLEGFITDVTDRKIAEESVQRNEKRLESLHRISQYKAENIEDLLNYALHETISLTESVIGYIYFYDESTKNFTLNSWSKDVMKQCTVADSKRVYNLDETGLWGEAVRQRAPIIVNDYESPNYLKKGYPDGHVPLKTFLTVPVIVDDEIVAVVGVANKINGYDQADARQLLLLMDTVWKYVLKEKSEQSVRESEQRYRDIFENSVEGIFETDSNGRFINVNPAFAYMHGFSSPDEMIERINNGGFQIFVKTEDRMRYIRTLKEKGYVENFEVQVRKKDKGIIWVSVNTRIVKDVEGRPVSYEGSAINITEGKKVVELLLESEKRYKGLFKHADEAILVVRGSRIIDCNEKSLEIFACKKDDIIGSSPHNFAPIMQSNGVDSRRGIAEKVKNAISGNPQLFEWEFIRKDMKPFYGEVSLSSLILDDEVLIHVIVRDITYRKETEDMLSRTLSQLELKNKELQEAHEELKSSQHRIIQQEKMASIGQLAAGVAHEINNPVGFIMSNLNTMEKYVDRLMRFMEFQHEVMKKIGADIGKEGLAEIEERRKTDKIDYIVNDVKNVIAESLEGTERVKKIVQDLKSFSRIDEKEYKLADINNGLETTINVVWNELKYKATVSKEYGTIPRTKCNLGQLNQVFMNILVNAAHAIDNQGEIHVRTSSEGRFIVVSISDTGRGMPPEVLNRVFEPFFTTKEIGKGTGLGLSIAYDIVKKHKGDIAVSSEVGRGTNFTITIPVVDDEEQNG